MFSRIHQHRALLPVLCGFVFLALWNNAIFWTFCPHVSATSHHCLTEESFSPSDMNGSSATMSHEHHDDMAMSEMDQKEKALDGATRAESKTGDLSIDIKPFTALDPLLSEAVTQSQGSCSHCIMHSQSGVNSPSAPMLLNNYASHCIVAAASSIVWTSLASPLTVVDVHDHGPPGLKSSRYILNNSFRI